jgi:hypothetical protein
MTPKQVKDIFDKLPSKRRKVLVGFLAGHSREKIMIDADVPSDDALTGHLKELYKNFRIVTGWNDADDPRSGARKLPLLISLFARCMPELIRDRNPDVLDGVEQAEAIANEPTLTNPLESDTAPKISIEVSSFLEYFSKSIDQLKSKDLDVRIGAISTLETIAKYSQPAEHWTIMEYLAAFVRTNAPRKEEGEEKRSPKISEVIQAALTVIVQRDWKKDPENQRLNLSNTDIRGAVLAGANLQGAILSKANLQGTYLKDANLQEVNLNGANLQETDLFKANLKWSKLKGVNLKRASFVLANLQEAYLFGANLERACLWSANLQGANLFEANLEEAHLSGANLQGTQLSEVNMAGARLTQVKLQGADLSRVKNLETQQLEVTYGDSQTASSLPDNIKAPKHWMRSK